MPRFYFDLVDSRGLHRDLIGDEFHSFEEARAQAQALLGDIAPEDLSDGQSHTTACDLRDDGDRLVFRGEITYRGTGFPG